MDIKGANPFLFTEEETSPNSSNSNPFLVNDDSEEFGSENPFLSSQITMAPSNSTNPFAFDPVENDTTNITQNANFPITTTNNVFTQDLFLSDTTITITTTAIQKPTDLDLKYINTESNTQPTKPPKETQDLLMSVMGEMDATSSHLLDKIPPTRTPSPVSMRDLHSPSPTPEPFADLVDVSDEKQDLNDLLMLDENDDVNQNVVQPMISNDMTQPMIPKDMVQPMIPKDMVQPMIPKEMVQPMIPNDMVQPTEIAPIKETTPPKVVPLRPTPPQRPCPPARPPRPALPPQKPPPPAIFPQKTTPPQPIQQPIQQSIQQSMQQSIQQPIQQPQQPIPQNSPFQAPQESVNDDILMFGDNIPTKPVTTQDILSLYNKPVEKQDFLCDNLEEITPKSSMENIQNDKTPQPLVQDNFLSPDPSHSDTQMDTSDSQSKGSASSVTFNPFAVQDIPVSKTPGDETCQEDVQMEEEEVEEIKEEIKESEFVVQSQVIEPIQNVFSIEPNQPDSFQDQDMYQNHFNQPEINNQEVQMQSHQEIFEKQDAFDAFTAKFESAVTQDENKNGGFDAFGESAGGGGGGTWGDSQISDGFNDSSSGFGPDESFDAFLAMKEPPAPQSTPNKFTQSGSLDSEEEKDFSVVIRPKNDDVFVDSVLPTIAPPTIPMVAMDSSPRFNPFDLSEQAQTALPHEPAIPFEEAAFKRTDSQETPPTPLFDDDVSQPLEPFPRMEFTEDGWEIQLRQPNKKKITGQRFWRKMWLRVYQTGDTSYLQLFNNKEEKNPVQELPLQPCYSVSDIGAQQYDTFGKIFTVKIQYIFYKERPGIRPGQVKKAERITNKLSQFAAYAIQGDYQGVKEFGSDLKKLGLPVEHAPQVSQLMKLGSLSYEDLKRFSFSMEEALFKMNAHRDRALQFKMEEVQITAVDELYVEQDAEGHVEKQIARVRLFFLGFLTGMPDIELGINDMRRQGKEVVGRHDIIPVATEEWIRLEAVEFHSCVQQDEYEKSHIIKFQPPDACYIELMRFRIRPPKNRELPLQLKPTICISGNKVELRADVLVPGFASRKLGQVPCEDVMIRFPIPECWIYLFRVEKHFRYGSVKSTHRRTGKVKGIERILGTVDTLQESLIEVTSGQAKYEHQHRAIVWRCPRLPKEGQGAYTTHNMVCRLALTSYDQMPEKLAEYCYVEFTMPATQVSHTTVRSVSLQNSDSDEPPEKYVRYLARHEYRVGIEHTEGQGPAAYEVATSVTPKTPATIPEQVPNAAESSTDSD